MRVYVSRRYHLSASHRLHAESLSADANREAYGKCNNPYGHGHNYVVEVTFSGDVDPQTGMVADLAQLDQFARQHVLARFDHANLNTLDEFSGVVPTTENFAVVLHGIFAAFAHSRLEKVHVEETENNSFDYAGAGDWPGGGTL